MNHDPKNSSDEHLPADTTLENREYLRALKGGLAVSACFPAHNAAEASDHMAETCPTRPDEEVLENCRQELLQMP